MLDTRAGNSGDAKMRDSAFISPSTSPGQPVGVVLPLPSSPAPHPSPPPTPSCSPAQDTSSPIGFDRVHKVLRRDSFHSENSLSECGREQCQNFTSLEDRLKGFGDKKENIASEAIDVSRCDDVSESEEVIDVIGDDTGADVMAVTPDYVDSVEKDGADRDVMKGGSSVEDSTKENRTENDENSDESRRQESPTSVTNFSIAAILKPDFGPARKLCLDFHAPHHLNHHGNHASDKPSFNLHGRFFNLHHNHHYNHHHNRQSQHHHHHHQQQQQHLQAHQQPHQRLSIASPAPVDLSTRGRGHLLGNANSSPDKDSVKRNGNGSSVADHTGVSRKGIKDSGGKDKKAMSAAGNGNNGGGGGGTNNNNNNGGGGVDDKHLWPAWVFCTRYSDRPSSGPRSRRVKRKEPRGPTPLEEKRPRTAFTTEQLARLKREFDDCRYLTETRRRHLASQLGLTESQIKIWFQNKRAKMKKSSGVKNELALQLMAQGLYNHSTVAVDEERDGRRGGSDDDLMVC